MYGVLYLTSSVLVCPLQCLESDPNQPESDHQGGKKEQGEEDEQPITPQESLLAQVNNIHVHVHECMYSPSSQGWASGVLLHTCMLCVVHVCLVCIVCFVGVRFLVYCFLASVFPCIHVHCMFWHAMFT